MLPTAPSTGRSAARACSGADAFEAGVGAPCRRVVATGSVFASAPAAMAHSSRIHAADRAILFDTCAARTLLSRLENGQIATSQLLKSPRPPTLRAPEL